ncbi:Chitin synthase 8 [Choanephora cucurbitarum]|uniref:chitin synthase n=1 Tax=Choanephora cucurbitarum TaxID=101091 RepID=A0A1C7N8W6_9FUNG|nr:Chitin synthase 8 [Choanephora cucurbitarum]
MTKERRNAWREKLALFLSYLIIGAVFCFWLEFITALFCELPATYEFDLVYANNSKLSSINGIVVDWEDYGNTTQMTEQVNKYPHLDLSPMFPSFMQLQRPADQTYYNNKVIDDCINGFNRSTQADNWLKHKLANDPGYKVENNRLVSCPYPTQRNKTGAPCFYSIISEQQFNRYSKKGAIKYDTASVYHNFSKLPHHGYEGQAYVILDGTVLDVTDYLDAVTNVIQISRGVYSRSFALDRMFLPLDLTLMFFVHMGEDITPYYYSDLDNPIAYRQCLNTLFFNGVIDLSLEDQGCAHINLALWITLGCFLLYFLVRMNLAHLSRLKWIQELVYKSRPSTHSAEQSFRRTLSIISNNRFLPPYTLLFVPCFSESAETIRQTFDSLARTNYPDTRKVLCFVCDGLVKNKDDSKKTYECILNALGYSSTKDPELRSYISLGQGSRRMNYAKVYAGFYELGRNRVPFLLIVKVGTPQESLSTTRGPGNRGKRDSMLIILGFFERCMNLAYHRITPLEFELFNLCYNVLGIDPRQFKYMLVSDADIQVQDDAICRLVSRLEADPSCLAVSGHIRPANPEENVVTMLQILPIYMTFYSGLAYEACLGTVSTINGGFIMYRLWSETNQQKRTLHPIAQPSQASQESARPLHFNTHQIEKMATKTSDEIPADDMQPVEGKDDDSSSDDNVTSTITTNTTVTSTFRSKLSYRRRLHKKKKKAEVQTNQSTTFSFALNSNIEPFCIRPTVLRGLAAPKPNTMHMENVLLQGEEQYISIVLLRSNPRARLAFEPEAIGYAVLPTNFFDLQALQVRNMRAMFHLQLEFQHVAKHLGFMYWIMSVTKLVDMIFSMPIIVYLYSIFIRYFMFKDLAYAIIAGSFSILILLHMVYFVLRRQFKYVLWFIIYGLFAIPIFNVWFPLLSVWRSDYGNCWYDIWPTQFKGSRQRLHGILPDIVARTEEKNQEQVEEEDENEERDSVPRMRLVEFEALEAEKTAQREKEQAEILDAKFNGFQGYVSGAALQQSGHTSKPSWSSSHRETPNLSFVSSPSMVQLRDRIRPRGANHSQFTMDEDAYWHLHNTPAPASSSQSSPRNPFVHDLDDVSNSVVPPHLRHHRQSHSQSSYFSRSSFNYDTNMFAPSPSISGPSAIHLSVPQPDKITTYDDNDSVISLSNSVISLSADSFSNTNNTDDIAAAQKANAFANHVDTNENNIDSPHHILNGRRTRPYHSTYHDQASEGRSTPVHSRYI